MIRFLVTLIAMAAVGYAVFFVPLAGKTLAMHTRDVWNSPVMQQKVKLIQKSFQPAKPRQPPADEAYSEQDRQFLNSLLDKVHKDR